MLFGFGEQPVFYAALTWRVLKTKNRVNKTRDVHKAFKDFLCMYVFCMYTCRYIYREQPVRISQLPGTAQ